MERVTVAEAAKRLNVTQEAIRQRIRRETIQHEKGDDGRTYVYLEPDTSRDKGVDNGVVKDVDKDVLLDYVETLKTRIQNLEEESRRKDHLLAAALERIPAIEAPQEPSESPVSPSDEAGKGEEEPERRSWLYRFFFGPGASRDRGHG